MAPVNLSNLTKEKFKSFLDSFDLILSDIDGTICTDVVLPGVPDFFHYVEKFGKSVYYVTNNTILSSDEFERKFNKCGIENGMEKLIFPTKIVAEYFKMLNFDKTIFCIAYDVAVKVLESHGLKCKTGPLISPPQLPEYLEYFMDDPEIGAVYLDIDFQVNMAKAWTYLKRTDIPFVIGPRDKVYPISKKLNIFLPNIVNEAIIENSGRTPIVLAKPSREFSKIIEKHCAITDPKRVLVIGDSLHSDVGLGKEAGYQTLFLLTTHNYEYMINEEVNIPDYYAKDLGELLPLMKNI